MPASSWQAALTVAPFRRSSSNSWRKGGAVSEKGADGVALESVAFRHLVTTYLYHIKQPDETRKMGTSGCFFLGMDEKIEVPFLLLLFGRVI